MGDPYNKGKKFVLELKSSQSDITLAQLMQFIENFTKIEPWILKRSPFIMGYDYWISVAY